MAGNSEYDRSPFRVLGPFEVRVGGEVLDVGGFRVRTVLAVLLAGAGRVTSVGALAEALWGEDLPPDAHRTVRTYVSRLRRALAPVAAAVAEDELVVTRPPGYLLRTVPWLVDAHEFARLAAAGRTAPEPAVAVERLSAALALWRGDAYGEFTGTPVLRSESARLHGLRLAVVEDRVDAELATGAGAALVEELTGLTEGHPGRDRLWAQLMTALYRAGRQPEALDAYARARTALVERFGLDPSPQLADLHRRILDNDTGLLGTSRTEPIGVTRAVSTPVRNDLPADIADFAGRRGELDRLLAAGVTAPVVIDGMAGVGKTSLAVHVAHRLAARYRDAQLFLDLHGHTSNHRPVTPMAALGALLRALAVPAGRIPNDLDARAALWRAELASRSALVVLDNAVDAAQVRPLLPGAAGSLVLVTARSQLVDLEAAHVVSLDVLPERDAVALFAGVVGEDRAAAEAGAVREVVDQCGQLPLAIRIAAARLRTRPAWTVRYLADRLRSAHRPLVELSGGGRSVAAAFALSYDHLGDAKRRMFRLLGVHPGPDFDAAGAAAVAAVDLVEAERLVEGLVDDHLLRQPEAGRYRFHDLVRQYAYATALAEEPEADRRRALRRVVDFYLHTAYRGSRALDQQHPPIGIGRAAEGCVPAVLDDDESAMAWFDANHATVLAVRKAAEEAGWDAEVWRLAWTLDNFHYRRGHLHDNIVSWEAGLAAAKRLGDLAVQARAHRRLGLVYAPLGRHAEAMVHLRRSLALSAEVGDVLGRAGAHFVLALALTHLADDRGALEHVTSARNLYRELGDAKWEARALSMIGACHTRLGNHEEARSYCESGLALCRRQGDVYGQADSLDSLGAAAGEAGRHAEAVRYYRQALTLWRGLDNTYRLAGTLAAVGDAHRELGEPGPARQAWDQAIAFYRAQDLHAAADRIERRAEPRTGPQDRLPAG